VALIVGITGACRKQKLSQLKINEIEDLRSAVLSALVKILDTEIKNPRSFTITGEFYKIKKKYAALRLPYTIHF
jgi:hypothetical protein